MTSWTGAKFVKKSRRIWIFPNFKIQNLNFSSFWVSSLNRFQKLTVCLLSSKDLIYFWCWNMKFSTQTSLSNSWYILYQFSFMYLWMFSKWSYFNTQFNMGEFASLSALSLACILWNFSDLKRNCSVNSRTATSKKLPQFCSSCFFKRKIALWQTL